MTNGSGLGTGQLHFNAGVLEFVNGTQTLNNAIVLNTLGTIQVDAGADWTLTGEISESTPNSLVLNGSGRVVLDNTNHYSGGTVLDGPTLGLTSGSNLGTSSLTFNLGTLELISGVETLNNAVILNGPGIIQANTGADWTLSGLISGGNTNVVILNGDGKISLNHANTYSGGTILNGPTLGLTNGSGLGTGPLTLTSGLVELENGNQTLNNSIVLNGAGSFQVDNGSDWSLHGVVSDGGAPSPLRLLGPGKMSLNALNTYSQGTYLDGGILAISQDENLGDLASSVTFGGGALEITSSSFSTGRSFVFDNDATILIDAGISHLNGSLTGIGGFTKGGAGGLSIESSTAYTGNTLMTMGTLFANADISSSPFTIINPGATLGGNGRLANVDLFGVLSPGNSIGTLTVNQIIFEPQSTYHVEIIGTSSDLLIAEDTITILPGSTIFVDPMDIQQEDYTIAVATNGINGTFSNVSSTNIRYQFNVNYLENAMTLHFLRLVPFADFFCGGNLKHIATCWDYFVNMSTPPQAVSGTSPVLQQTSSPEMNHVLTVLNSLSAVELFDAFNQLDPGIYQSVNLAELDVAHGLLDFYDNHIHNDWDFPFIPSLCEQEKNRFDWWIAPFGLITERKGSHRLRAYHSYQNKEAAIASGLDFNPQKDLCFTAGLAYSHNQLHWNHANVRASFQSYSAMVGSSFATSSMAVDACVVATYNSAKGKIRILIDASPLSSMVIDPIDYTLKNHNQSYSIASRLGLKYNLYSHVICEPVICSIWPFANVDYAFLHQCGYQENGGSILDMAIGSRNADLLKPEAGIGITFVNTQCDVEYFTEGSLAFGREYRLTGKSFHAKFKHSSGCSFKVDGLFPQSSFVIPRFSIGAKNLDGSLEFIFSYNGAFGPLIKKNELTAQLSVGF